MTNEGMAFLIKHEGEVLHAYSDSQGFLTIGVGHLIDSRRGGAIPQRISRELLADDIAVATVRARAAFAWFDALDPARQDAIVNLVFNMGIEGVKRFGLMIEAIEAQDWGRASYELFNSLWAKQVQKERVDDLRRALENGRWL